MGVGDQMMALGDAWKVHRADAKRRPVAVGDGRRLVPIENDLDRGLDFLASQADLDVRRPVQWVLNHPGGRPYHDRAAMNVEAARLDAERFAGSLRGAPRRVIEAAFLALRSRQNLKHVIRRTGHFIYDYRYRASPAPILFSDEEKASAAAAAQAGPFVLVEPYIKTGAPPSKQWPIERFHAVALRLAETIRVVQISAPDQPRLDPGIERIHTATFRQALAVLSAAQLYVGPEGALHHGAAATGTPAVVIFGGFTAPEVVGYEGQVCLTGGAAYACGTRLGFCPHCREALERISVEDVLGQARRLLDRDQG